MKTMATQRAAELFSRFASGWLDRVAEYSAALTKANSVNSRGVFRPNRHAICWLTVEGQYEPVTVRSCLADWPFQIVPGGTK